MKILVTGACGQLGTELRVRSHSSAHEYIFTDIRECEGGVQALDITDEQAVFATAKGADAIVNCAAYTNVDKAEDDVAMATLLNRDAPGILARAAREQGATLIHISTDYVFDGNATAPLKPSDPTGPTSVYGSTKLAGEKAITTSGCNSIIIRTAWLYSPYGKNFVKTMKTLTAEKPELKVVNDQVGTPTYAGDLADAILHIIDNGLLGKTGVYHYSNEGVISWYDFAKEIGRLCGGGCVVKPCTSEEFPSKVRRPHYSVLDKTSIKETFGVDVPDWQPSLVKCLSLL